jgi:hypothetical protein
MSLVSICIVLSAFLLVTSLVVCGFLYLSYVSISRDVADEDTYILIDNDESVVSSICKEILHESRWAKTLGKSSETFTTTHENIKPHNGNVVQNEGQRTIHSTEEDTLPNNLNSVVVSKYQCKDNNASQATTNESVKLIPILKVMPSN